MKIILYIAWFFPFILLSFKSFSQSLFSSESLIKYDLSTHKTDKPIPFDRSFTLVIDKLSSKNIISVQAYQMKFENGQRLFVTNSIQDFDGTNVNTAIFDVELKINPYSDTLQIFFPPLKPNIDFDINVIYGLKSECLERLMTVNAALSESLSSANNLYNNFFACTIDKLIPRSYVDVEFPEYEIFYRSSLMPLYQSMTSLANFPNSATLSETEIKAVDIVTSRHLFDFADGAYLIEAFKRSFFPNILLGNIDIKKVFLPDAEASVSIHAVHARLKNYESNIKLFDSILRRLDRVISKGEVRVMVDSASLNVDTLRVAIANIKSNLQTNYDFLCDRMKQVARALGRHQRIKYGIYLAGHTVSTDLKTAGGNVLFVDAGFANIVAPDLRNNPVYISKLYWGVNIYFRPIDKNTRRGRFPKKFTPSQNNGCKIEVRQNATGAFIPVQSCGPDYGIVSKWSIWQHLSLNIGITLGKFSNSNFENFYGENSLTIGPAFRFNRAFKFSTGVALLKRSSKNPLVSDKKTVAAIYGSLSVDIDFIQSIKDVTSIFFK